MKLCCASSCAPAGALGIYWKLRFERLVEDSRLFYRLLTHPDWQLDLSEERDRLVREFEEVYEQASDGGETMTM